MTPPSSPSDDKDVVFRQAEQAGHIGAWYSDIGLDTEKLVWSDESYRIFGLTPETFHQTVSEWLARIHPDDRDAVVKASRAATDHDVPYSIEHRIIRPDGAIRWVHEQAQVIRDPQGKALRMVGIVQDITERKNSEQAQQELVSIIESAPDYIGSFSPEYTATYLNDSFKRILPERYGQFVHEPWKIPVSAFYPPEAYQLLHDTAVPAAIKHGLWQGENALADSSGHPFPVLQTVIAHTSKTGQLLYFSTIARDISAAKSASERITRLNRTYAFLSQVNQAIVHVQTRQELFERMATAAVDKGGFRMAWIGLKDGDDLKVATQAGVVDGYLDNVGHDPLLAKSVLGDTWVSIVNDVATDPRMAEMRDKALKGGYRSLVSFALRPHNVVIGALTVYADVPAFFTEEEMMLLTEVSQDINFALESLGEKTLRQGAELRFQTLVEQSPIPIQIFRPDGLCTYVNPAWAKLWDTAREEVAGYNILKDEQAKAKGVMGPVLKAFGGENAEVPTFMYDPALLGKKGRPRWIHSTLYPIKDAAGAVQEVVHVTEDLTDQYRAVEQLKVSEEMYRVLAEAANDIIFIIRKDDTVGYVNPAAAGWIGKPREQIVGRPRVELFAPQTAQRQGMGIKHVLETGQPLTADEMNTVGGVERYLSTSLSPIRDAQGMTTAVLGISHEITKARTVEKNLRDSEERYRSITEYSMNAIILLDSTAHVITANPAAIELLGYTMPELVGMSMEQTYLPVERPVFRQRLADFHSTKKLKLERTLLRHDGTTRIVQIFVTELPNGQILQFIQDISEQKAAQAKASHLRELEKLNKVMIGREMRIVELKQEVAQLKTELTKLGVKPTTQES